MTVRGNSPTRTRGELICADLVVPCALGRNGIALAKSEGDGITPAGRWPLRHILYRPDRVDNIDSQIPSRPLQRHDGWCDAPDDELYNRHVTLPYPASAEELWRRDTLYDIIVVLGHNDDPVVAGKGSAIFFHIARPDYGPTEGCVAISLADMKLVLKLCGPQTIMQIDV